MQELPDKLVFTIRDTLKTSRPGKHLEPIHILAYSRDLRLFRGDTHKRIPCSDPSDPYHNLFIDQLQKTHNSCHQFDRRNVGKIYL